MSKLVDIVTAGSQKITLRGPQRTPLGILRVKVRKAVTRVLLRVIHLPASAVPAHRPSANLALSYRLRQLPVLPHSVKKQRYRKSFCVPIGEERTELNWSTGCSSLFIF